jgi:hypothetical protein
MGEYLGVGPAAAAEPLPEPAPRAEEPHKAERDQEEHDRGHAGVQPCRSHAWRRS